MGVGPVSSVVLDHLLLLRLERSKVHREGSAITFFMLMFQAAVELLKRNALGMG